jgi:dCMP deaminase
VRITRDMMFMLMAEAAARRSTCRRLNVGAIITHDNNVISIGYNGPASGEPHCTGSDCGVPHCTRSLHAEANAIDRADLGGLHSFSCTLYVTNSPCPHCFNKIINTCQIGRVVFRDEYRISDHLRNDYGIRIEKITPSGYLTDFATGEILESP